MWPRARKGDRRRVPGLDEPLREAESVEDRSAADLFAEQPHLRTVVTFLARNVAQLGLHVYERADDGGRERVRDGGLAELLAQPNPETTTYELVYGMVADLALYDQTILWVIPGENGRPAELRRIEHDWISETYGSTAFAIGGYVLQLDDSGDEVRVPAADTIVVHGWSPGEPRAGMSPIGALKEILREQISASVYRRQLWDNGGRVGTFITRPKDAPEWSNEGRARFKRGWKEAYTGNGKKVGGVPVLEDGMTLNRVGFSSKEEDWVEGTKLALTQVASVYHVNPAMVGVLDNANYSNVREFRQMLYSDTLGPILAMIEARINAFLVPRFADDRSLYVEFNTRQKLDGSFSDQMAQYARAIEMGALTRNEVRAAMNRPAIEGGDVMLTPLNMYVGTPAAGEAA